MRNFTRKNAEIMAEINNGKVSPNMDYLTFPGYWSNQQMKVFESRFDNVGITNGTGTISTVENPMSNADFVRTPLVMVSWN